MNPTQPPPAPAAWIDEQAVRAFAASNGPDGPSSNPETTWEHEIGAWGQAGSADFARHFEPFLYAVQRPGAGLNLCDDIRVENFRNTTSVLMDITTISAGIADAFVVRFSLRAGVEISAGSEDLHHLAQGTGLAAALDALTTVAGMINGAFGRAAAAAETLHRNRSSTAAPATPAATVQTPLPVGMLACPECRSVSLTTHERGKGTCSVRLSREYSADKTETFIHYHDGKGDWQSIESVGVQCDSCGWIYVGEEWDSQLALADAEHQ